MLLCVMNFWLNFSENRFKAVKLVESKSFYNNLKSKLPTTSDVSVLGVLNSSAKFVYWGRYILGEEISFIDDHYLPMLLKVGNTPDKSLENLTYYKSSYPKCLLDTLGPINPQEVFVKKYPVNPIIVPYKDLEKFSWIHTLCIDSLDNSAKKHRIFFMPSKF